MLFLIPGAQIYGLYMMLVAMLEFFVWPSIYPNSTLTLSGFTFWQWGCLCLMFAF